MERSVECVLQVRTEASRQALMAAPRTVKTVILSVKPTGDGRFSLRTNDGKFNTALNSEASRQAAGWVRGRTCEISFHGGLPATLSVWTRGTVVKISR